MEDKPVPSPVPLSKLFFPGQTIALESCDSESDDVGTSPRYEFKVARVLPDRLLVNPTGGEVGRCAFPAGANVKGHMSRFGVRHCFDAKASWESPSQSQAMGLVAVAGLRKADRRDSVRMGLSLRPESFSVLGDQVGSALALAPVVDDVSPGGFGISCRQEIPMGSRLQLALALPKLFGRIQATGEVVRIEGPMRDLTGQWRWRMGVAFSEISQNDRNRVAAFVLFEQHRRMKANSPS